MENLIKNILNIVLGVKLSKSKKVYSDSEESYKKYTKFKLNIAFTIKIWTSIHILNFDWFINYILLLISGINF